MKIALIGYGKMGKCIEKLAIKRGHNIHIKTNTTPSKYNLQGIDVAIEFTNPQFAYKNLRICLENNIPTVCGTTGWLDKSDTIKEICIKKKCTFLFTSNFSIGVNIFFKINRYLAEIIVNCNNKYDKYIDEIHHNEKKDYPSGTSITIAKNICKDGINDKKLLIYSKRLNNYAGIHVVKYQSSSDEMIFRHESKNRNGLSYGAIIASEWIKGKNGIFTMKDVLNI